VANNEDDGMMHGTLFLTSYRLLFRSFHVSFFPVWQFGFIYFID